MLFLSVILTGSDKMNIYITLLKSLWCEQTCEPIKISMSRMRVAIIVFYWMNITHNLPI